MSRRLLHSRIIVISDLHIGEGRGNKLDQFLWDEDFERFLSGILPQSGPPVSLVINGDFVDFPQVLPQQQNHRLGDRVGASEDESVARMQAVLAGHPRVFAALRSFLEKGGQVLLLAGNHDAEFYFPRVLAALREALGGVSEPAFVFVEEAEIHEQGLHIEHGHQYSYDNRFDTWPRPILPAKDGPRLERPWGTLFLDLVYNKIEALVPFVHLVKPHDRLAWIALRKLLADPQVPADVTIRFLTFFLAKGKRYLIGQLMGEEKEGVISADSLTRILKELCPEVEQHRLQALTEDTIASLRAGGGAPGTTVGNDSSVALKGLLGRTDERGMKERARVLLAAQDVNLVVFGHTHLAIDGHKEPWWGDADPRRWFNTGSWMPTIFLGDLEKVSWEDLPKRTPRREVYYLEITPGKPAKAQLMPFT